MNIWGFLREVIQDFLGLCSDCGHWDHTPNCPTSESDYWA